MVRALFVSNAVSSELRKAIAALAGRWSNTECVEGCGLEIQNCDFYVGRTTDGHYGRASHIESRATCAEFIGKHVVAIGYK